MNPQERHVEKIKNILGAIRNESWSVNEFLIHFYNSDDPDIRAQANRNLTYVEGTRYGPDRILNAWTSNVPNQASRDRLNRSLTEQVTHIVVDESTRAYRRDDLHLPANSATTAHFTTDFAFENILRVYRTVLPCLWMILYALLVAANDYERKHGPGFSKKEKDFRASGIILVIISMLLFGRNRATNLFQLVFGVFLSSSGAGRRVLDVCNHMGLSVSYMTVHRCLRSLTRSARSNVIDFIKNSDRLFAVVYDNINFTLRKAGQRIDNTTEQLNATTAAVVALPLKFSRAVHAKFLSRNSRKHGLRKDMKKEDLRLTPDKQRHIVSAFKCQVQLILLHYAPGLKKASRRRKRLMKKSKELAPELRPLGFEKTLFFPLPALDEEESSVAGTIRVVKKIFTVILDMAVGVIESQLRLMVGDWLTIRNLRLMREERSQEFNLFEILLGRGHHSDLKTWRPKWDEFEQVSAALVEQFASTAAGHDALEHGDEMLAHSIFFIRDALLFFEFNSAIKDADVGRMWMVYDHWLFMMRGAGCHNYGNEILEMKAQFKYEYVPELAEIVEHTWIVNRWGQPGKSIATDRYLEHNNGFMKTMFDAQSSGSSLDFIINKSSACVEVLRALAHAMTSFFGIADYHRGHREVDISSDVAALCLDMETQALHTFHLRRVPPPVKATKKEEGRDLLIHKGLFEKWKKRTGEADDEGADPEDNDLAVGTAFEDPNSALALDHSIDPELDDECPFGNADVVVTVGEDAPNAAVANAWYAENVYQGGDAWYLTTLTVAEQLYDVLLPCSTHESGDTPHAFIAAFPYAVCAIPSIWPSTSERVSFSARVIVHCVCASTTQHGSHGPMMPPDRREGWGSRQIKTA
ncbi:hypothetical protein EWM64_g9660 [Hericium alpestre]|uniref:DUF6589 domain-containing protein n=1 Tax=Hericium alpestre TaxID=135208 RepID=A0A4Y9ZKH2_9AGAM|nr:hypothetical protein EWM64_g9660 [Hericium alpestre]